MTSAIVHDTGNANDQASELLTHKQAAGLQALCAQASAHPVVGDEWPAVCARMGFDLETSAREQKALQRRRAVQSAAVLLRLVLAYSLLDLSTRLVGAWATWQGIAELSDRAVSQRLKAAAPWLRTLLGEWLHLRRLAGPSRTADAALQDQGRRRLCVVDATTDSAPGSTGTDWRMHTSYDVLADQLVNLQITDSHTGESLRCHAGTFQAGDIILADRIYANSRVALGELWAWTLTPEPSATSPTPALAIAALENSGGPATPVHDVGVVLRVPWSTLPLQHPAGGRWGLRSWLRRTVRPAGCAETEVVIETPAGLFLARLVAVHLTPEAAARAQRRTRRRSSKAHGRTPSTLSLEMAQYVVLLTNLAAPLWSTQQVLELYRVRWQAELLYKRMKSIMKLDAVPTKGLLGTVYLLGKWLGAVLLEGWQQDGTAAVRAWAQDETRPLSQVRWLQFSLEALRAAVRGPLSWEPDLTPELWAKLKRYFCDTPRRRKQQRAHVRRQFEQLNSRVFSRQLHSLEAMGL